MKPFALTVADIDRANQRVHIRQGKGNKDRFVPLPEPTLKALADFWRLHRHPSLLFPAGSPLQQQPVDGSGGIQTTIRLAAKDAGISSGSMCILCGIATLPICWSLAEPPYFAAYSGACQSGYHGQAHPYDPGSATEWYPRNSIPHGAITHSMEPGMSRLACLLRDHQQALVEHYGHRFRHNIIGPFRPSPNATHRSAVDSLSECNQCHFLKEQCRSCGHRSCPECQYTTQQQWLSRQLQNNFPSPTLW